MCNADYRRCRSVAHDKLENAEYLGINEYVDCYGTESVGYENLLSDFTSYNLTIPVIVSKWQNIVMMTLLAFHL